MLVQNFGALRQFVPAELKHNSKGWYIEYYKLNPIVQDLERVRIMMNRERKRCKTLTEFKLQTSAIFFKSTINLLLVLSIFSKTSLLMV